MRLFSREKRRIELQSGRVVERFDIEKDCAYCGERLHEGHRFSVYCEYDASMKDLHAKLIEGPFLGKGTNLIRFNFHGCCANKMYGREVAASEK